MDMGKDSRKEITSMIKKMRESGRWINEELEVRDIYAAIITSGSSKYLERERVWKK